MFHFLWHSLHTNKCLGFFNKKKNLLKLFTKTDSFEFHDHFFFFQTWTSSSSFKAWIMMLKVLENLMIQETCIKRLIFSKERERESFNYWVLFQVPDCCQYIWLWTRQPVPTDSQNTGTEYRGLDVRSVIIYGASTDARDQIIVYLLCSDEWYLLFWNF